MARKKTMHSSVVSATCFRLLRLKSEIQSDVTVLKAVVDEVDVLRLCRSLGMVVSDEGNSNAMHNFEFGLFNSSDYDTDFARFIREKIVAGNDLNSRGEDSEDLLEIGCLFGKQREVKAELTRMGVWSTECEEVCLSLKLFETPQPMCFGS
ncbi:hypothetical protein PHMEG_00034281 [Phytophthora megakarya]|uniref:Uncharacterized protein n=1 Tax=Phytophthora megakarya TaxID=4795 RepID=A0A225URD1_9STRA|nr:hypothetical protein PHMEG_00034281 [Phytophthora megakarya]